MIRKKIWLWLLIIVPLILFAGFSVWAYTPLGPMPEALFALKTDSTVHVSDNRWIVFEPTEDLVDTGIIIYPGGRVDPRSYAPIAKDISAEGYLVVVVPMPFNLAVFGAERAINVMEAYPDIEYWIIAGHSLGGSMAARFAQRFPGKVDGLALWASYPAATDDLSNTSLLSMSVFGTRDGLTSTQEIANSRLLLPANTTWVPVEGGNHAQFGWYGSQPGDNPARISREQQQEIILEAMINLLQDVK
jgi:pimeloyl-ACP methyl ester carboxylesterase